jgi:hypothetical protein
LALTNGANPPSNGVQVRGLNQQQIAVPVSVIYQQGPPQQHQQLGVQMNAYQIQLQQEMHISNQNFANQSSSQVNFSQPNSGRRGGPIGGARGLFFF